MKNYLRILQKIWFTKQVGINPIVVHGGGQNKKNAR